MTNPLIARLQAAAVLPDDDRWAVEAICGHARSVEKGRELVREGDKPEHVTVLLEGWAARYMALPDGSRQITAFLLPGDLCDAEPSGSKRMDYSVTALTPVTVSLIERQAVIRLTRERGELAQAFWRASLVDQAVLRAWVVSLGRRNAYTRIAHLICELHARMKALGLANGAAFDLPLTQEQLGDALGLTPIHVNRVLKLFRDEGVMELRNRTLTLHDAKRLGAAAGFDPGYLHPVAAL